jgi:hypothetical protein
MRLALPGTLAFLALAAPAFGYAADCNGKLLTDVAGAKALGLSDGGLAAFGKMNINVDGYGKAYHSKNFEGGAVISSSATSARASAKAARRLRGRSRVFRSAARLPGIIVSLVG